MTTDNILPQIFAIYVFFLKKEQIGAEILLPPTTKPRSLPIVLVFLSATYPQATGRATTCLSNRATLESDWFVCKCPNWLHFFLILHFESSWGNQNTSSSGQARKRQAFYLTTGKYLKLTNGKKRSMFGVKCNENCISSRQLPSFYAFF